MRSKLLRRTVLAVAILVLVAVSLLGAVHLPPVRARVLEWTRGRVSRDFGIDVTASALRYNLLGVSIELQDANVSARGDQPFLTTGLLRVVLNRRLFTGTVDIERLELTRPHLTVVRHRDGSTNLPTSQADPSSKPSPVHLGIVALSQLAVDVEDEARGHKAAIGPLDLTVDTRTKDAAPGAFGPDPIHVTIGGGEPGTERSLSGTFGGRLGFDGERVTLGDVRLDTTEGHLALTGWIDAIADTISTELQARFDTDLARAARLIGTPADSLAGTATAEIFLRGPIADPTMRVVMSARDLRYQRLTATTAQAEASYAAGRVAIQRLDLTSDLGSAAATGTLLVTSSPDAPDSNHLRAHLARIEIDRLLDAVGVQRTVRIGSMAAGDVDVTLNGPIPFSENWWRQLDATGSIQLVPTPSDLPVEGRLRVKLHDARWQIDHRLQSTVGPTSVNGTVSGEASRRADGAFESTLSGHSRLQIDELRQLTPLARRAGVELPPQISDIDGSVDAMIDPRGTLSVPAARATIAGRIRLPDFPESQLDSTIAVNRNTLTVNSLQAVAGPAAVHASGSYSWAGKIDARFDATADDLHALVRLAAADDVPVTGSARIVGQLQGTSQAPVARAELTAQGLDAYEVLVGEVTAQLRLANDRLEVDGNAPQLNARLTGTLDIREPYRYQAEATLDGSSVAALVPASTREQIATEGTLTATVKSQGTLIRILESTGEADLRALDVTVSGIPVVLEAPATVSLEPNALTATPVGLRLGAETNVRLQGTLGLNEVRSGLDIAVDGPLTDLLAMAAQALPDTPIQAEQSKVALNLHVGGTLQAPQPTGTMTVGAASFRYADQPPLTGVALEARIEPARIAVQSMVANWLGAHVQGESVVPLRMIVPATTSPTATTGLAAWGSNWLASLPGEPRSATLSARVTGITTDALAPYVDTSTLQSVSGTVDGTLTAEADGFTLDRVRGVLVLDRAALVTADVPFEQSAPTRIRLVDGRADIEEFRWHAGSNELRVSGTADLIAPDRPVDIAVSGDVDLRILGAFVSGVASGGIAHSDLTVKGPMAAPEILGTIGVTAGELRLDNPSFAASDIDGTIVVPADRDATISFKGTVNGGAAIVQGNLSLKEVTAPRGRIVLTARNVTLDYPEGFQTESNADLVLALAGAESTLSGRLDILSGLYREPLVVSRSLLSGFSTQTATTTEGGPSFLAMLALDITVATAEQLRVDNNYGRLNLTGHLQVTGTAAQPGAVGRIEAEPDGEIYLAGNTYRIESFAIDLTSPRTIAPDVTFLADTRVADVPIEVALQCSANGACEHEVRSQVKTSEEAEALLFGVSSTTDTAEAGAQLARLLSGELLGVVGQAFRLDTLRLERASTRADLFDDPTLIAGDVNPASRLTVGKRLGDHVELAYSQNLAQNGFTMSTQYFAPAGISARALLLDDQSRSFEFRHEPHFGTAARKRPASVAGATIAAVRWSGNPGFAESQLRGQLHLTDGDHFTFVDWQADRERLIGFYQARGFVEVRVRARRLLPTGEPVDTVSGDKTIETITLEYTIERGQPTRLEISGFDLPNEIRQRIIKRWASAIFDGFLERDAALIVREHLYGQRRLQAKVTATVEHNESDDGKTLRIVIVPGPVTSAQLVFERNAAIPTATLFEVARRAGPVAAWLDPASFALMLERVYRDEGLLSAKVTVQPPAIQGDQSIVRVAIREGEPWLVGRVTVEGTSVLGANDSSDRLGIALDRRYTPKTIADGVATLEQKLRDAGFLGAHVTAETALDPSNRRANVRVVAEPGQRTVLDSVTVEGSAANQAAVARAMTLETGAPVSASALSATRRGLYQTGVFRSVDIDLEPIGSGTSGDRKVIARFRVAERPRYAFRYGLALNDDVVSAGERNRKLGFAADLENRNVLGLGASVGLSARIRRDQEVGRMFVGVPRFFGLPLRSNVFLSRERQDIGSPETKIVSDVTQISGEQTYRLRRLVDVRYGYQLGRNQTTVTPLHEDPLVVTVRVARLTTSALIDRRNDPFDPTRGWFTSTSLELSRPGLGSELSFLKSFIQQFQFVPIGHGIVVASAARLGLARTYRDETLIPSERFFGGGATSVRGYRDDDLGPRSIFGDAERGAALLIGNGEVRFPIYRWLRGVGFVDLGNVYGAVTDLFHTGLQVGSGAGVRVNTPVGLLRLDLAAPLNPRSFDPAWTVHFGLGHAF